MNIKKRIYWSFFILVMLFVGNGIASLITLNNNKKLSEHVSTVVDPSLQSLEDFEDILIASKMYTTNWVFLRSNQDDKDALKHLHDIEYPELKTKLNLLSEKWDNKQLTDSLNKIYAGFEQLLVIEKRIMRSLQKFEDYDDPVAKLESEMLVEDELLPRTSSLLKELSNIVSYEINIRNQKNKTLQESFMELRMLISILAITIVCIGIFLSLYMARVIINPINKIRDILNDLGKGIIKKVDYKVTNDEIGEMVRFVNHLSEKLQATAKFAQEVGQRNFEIPFQPLSSEDTLGIALIAMRDNLKSGDEALNEAQNIAGMGSWERDLVEDKLTWSDGMFRIFDAEHTLLDTSYDNYFSYIHSEDKEHVIAITKRYYQDHQPFSYECRIITGKGVKKIIYVMGKVLLNDNNEIIKTYGVIQDITERKQGEEKLAEERKLFQLVIENIPDQIYVKDIESRFILCNMPVARIAGCTSVEEMIGKSDYDFSTEDIAKQFFKEEQDIIKTGIPLINHEERLLDNVTGKSHWNLSSKLPLKSNTGKIIGLIGINRNITVRKIAEIELGNVSRELNILFNSIDEVFFSVNMVTLKTIQISATCEKLYGYKQSEFMSNHLLWTDIIHPDDKHLIENEDKKMLRGEQVNNQYRIIHKDKNIRWVENAITPTLDKDGHLIRIDGIARDITKRKHAEELLKKSEATLAINNHELERKNKELEQFAYVASHDLQEPLSTTISFVELFKQQYFEKLDPKADKYLTYIVQATDRMKVLIKDLLDFSRIGHSKNLEKIDCNFMLRDIIADIDKAIKDSGTEINVAHLPVISGYPTEMKQLFQNLILNSIKFRKKNVPSKINIGVLKMGDYWEFAFNDNGIGIDQKHNERIFTIFQRLHTRSEYPGSGIGLSHCKKIVELHHGKIWVESIPNEGSTFYFTIHSPKEIINESKIKLHHAH
ncbi:MAG TPA: PAS domain-containing protein [Chitinophagaceae bacterium]|nr:PAS domain-containing protein [Chitinophagaceae bacterium]